MDRSRLAGALALCLAAAVPGCVFPAVSLEGRRCATTADCITGYECSAELVCVLSPDVGRPDSGRPDAFVPDAGRDAPLSLDAPLGDDAPLTLDATLGVDAAVLEDAGVSDDAAIATDAAVAGDAAGEDAGSDAAI